MVVDDFIPAMKGADGRWAPLFAQSREGHEVWSLLIEKAFAKLYGCYAAIEGGWVDDALMDLTGGVSERLSLHDADVHAAAYDGSLFARLLRSQQSGFLLGAGSPVGASDREEDASASGIVQSHAYSVLGLADVDGHQLIHVRNPWGRKEWTGDWSDRSALWTERLRAKVGGAPIADDGAFWMAWNDFVAAFDEVYLCRFYAPHTFPCSGSVDGAWDERSAGGCCNHATVERNAQFAVTPCDDGEVEVVLELIQRDTRGSAAELPLVILELYDNDGRPVTQQRRGQLKANKGAASLSVHITATWPKAERAKSRTWTLLPCTYEAGTLTSYTLRWYATREVHVAAFAKDGSTTAAVAAAAPAAPPAREAPATEDSAAQSERADAPQHSRAVSEAHSARRTEAKEVEAETADTAGVSRGRRRSSVGEADSAAPPFLVADSPPATPSAQRKRPPRPFTSRTTVVSATRRPRSPRERPIAVHTHKVREERKEQMEGGGPPHGRAQEPKPLIRPSVSSADWEL